MADGVAAGFKGHGGRPGKAATEYDGMEGN